jgi:ribonuclease-3 family protein
MTDLFDFLNGDEKIKAEEYSPLALAYIGDSVFDVYVRTMLLCRANYNVNKLHNMAKNYVSAVAQSQMYKKIEDRLTEEEQGVLRRGRNAKSFTTAKNSSVAEYRHATGLEALFGYLYLKGENERMNEIFKMCIEQV